uniref:Uncharacterized protein n=1 Tax=Rhipicephalus microplus TaxID=6941 RepID=A0A6G5AIC1_RHIMP
MTYKKATVRLVGCLCLNVKTAQNYQQTGGRRDDMVLNLQLKFIITNTHTYQAEDLVTWHTVATAQHSYLFVILCSFIAKDVMRSKLWSRAAPELSTDASVYNQYPGLRKQKS